MRRLVFFPDYYADPLWDLEDEAMVSVDALVLPPSLRAAVRNWAEAWTTANLDETVRPELHSEIDAQGHQLWLELRDALSGNVEVGYATFRCGRRKVQWTPDAPSVDAPPRTA